EARGVALVKGVHRQAELVRLPADLVQRQERRIAIIGRVLHALGGPRSAELLKPQHELARLGEALSAKVWRLEQERAAEDLPSGRWQLGGQGARLLEGGLDEPPIFLADPVIVRADVAAVRREAGDHFAQRLEHDLLARWLPVFVGGREREQAAGQAFELGS